jgi:hypothetical protein
VTYPLRGGVGEGVEDVMLDLIRPVHNFIRVRELGIQEFRECTIEKFRDLDVPEPFGACRELGKGALRRGGTGNGMVIAFWIVDSFPAFGEIRKF